jgi:hypothetical protein
LHRRDFAGRVVGHRVGADRCLGGEHLARGIVGPGL